ncbi:MAG: hypothetical protein HY000_35015, partial [Planctomycetes bacterium]|nr:hypothetical protein [Planctomycetota bacterium]
MSQFWLCLAIVTAPGVAGGQSDVAPQWIWHDEGNPVADAPIGDRFFRKTVHLDRIRVVKIDITCDDEFSLYFNGEEVGRSNDWHRVYGFDLTDRARHGANVLAVRAKNRGGPAGLLVRGYAGWANGTQWTFNADASWRSSAEEQPGWSTVSFDDSAWRWARPLGAYDRVGPWTGLTWDSRYASRFTAPTGFRIETAAPATLTGSVSAMTFDARGRPTVARERRPVA